MIRAHIFRWWYSLFANRCYNCGGYDIVGVGYYSEQCRSCGAQWADEETR